MQVRSANKATALLGIALGAIFAFCPFAANAKETLELKPTSPWVVDFAENVCILGRKFGEENDRVTLRIISDRLGRLFYVSAEGDPTNFKTVFLQRTRTKERTFALPLIRFGKDGKDIEAPAWNLVIDGTPGFKITREFGIGPNGATMIEKGQPIVNDFYGRDKEWVEQADLAAANIDRIVFSKEFKTDVALLTGPLASPLTVLRACTEDLITSWGIDLKAQKSLRKWPTPVEDPRSWFRESDYPSRSLMRSESGESNFTVLVDADGSPTDCKVPLVLGSPEFSKRACKVILLRGKFNPAIDADGNPTRSYWSSKLGWVMYNSR